MENIQISRVKMKNFRNLKSIDVELSSTQIIIGENNTGKSNFIRALQLVLDNSLREDERLLKEEDFNQDLIRPLREEDEVKIDIYISNFEEVTAIMAQFGNDALIEEEGEKYLKISYRCKVVKDAYGNLNQEYIIYKGEEEEKRFTYEDRKVLNLKVIKALRDAEKELRNLNRSPIKQLLKEYSISDGDLDELKSELSDISSKILDLEEIKYLEDSINEDFKRIMGEKSNHHISFDFFEASPQKLINSLKFFIDTRYVGDVSLGINNILYISLLLLAYSDRTVPRFLSKNSFLDLKENLDVNLEKYYDKTEKGNYFLKEKSDDLYRIFQKRLDKNQSITLLAIEEPEAHLHPIYQRLVYKEIISKKGTQVFLTTHSPHLTSIAPLKSIIHFSKKSKFETIINSTKDLNIDEGEILDIERYIDLKRGEVYFSKGVILVEGIAEEYLIPKFAEKLGYSLDEYGIIVCNINSTNFYPYLSFFKALNIPYVVLTDGDYYHTKEDKNGKKIKVFGDTIDDYHVDTGYYGYEVMFNNLKKLSCSISKPNDIRLQKLILNINSIYTSMYTLETEIMIEATKNDCRNILCDIFNELTSGGAQQKKNFKDELENEDYAACLRKISDAKGVGKGRFAQRLSSYCTEKMIPSYIKNGIKKIVRAVEVKFDE